MYLHLNYYCHPVHCSWHAHFSLTWDEWAFSIPHHNPGYKEIPFKKCRLHFNSYIKLCELLQLFICLCIKLANNRPSNFTHWSTCWAHCIPKRIALIYRQLMIYCHQFRQRRLLSSGRKKKCPLRHLYWSRASGRRIRSYFLFHVTHRLIINNKLESSEPPQIPINLATWSTGPA